MAKTNNLGDFLKDVADGIRTARGATGSIAAQNFRTEIEKLKPANYIDPSQASKVYKHTITITAPGATGSYGTSTISCSNIYLYSTSLSTSIAGEYNASNWATLVGHFRNSFNTVEAIVNPYNSGNCKGISTSCTGADGYLGTIYVLDYNGYIGGYLNYTYSSISYGSASASNYLLKNFSSGNVIVTDVVTELGG